MSLNTDKKQRKDLNAAEIGALAHLYRAEVYRSTIWRMSRYHDKLGCGDIVDRLVNHLCRAHSISTAACPRRRVAFVLSDGRVT
ncbi:hypothetical protein ACEWL3_019070 [Sulfitobacter sp. MF3-043]